MLTDRGPCLLLPCRAKKAVLYGTEQDVHESIQTDAAAANLHDSAERFDPAAEAAFRWAACFPCSLDLCQLVERALYMKAPAAFLRRPPKPSTAY